MSRPENEGHVRKLRYFFAYHDVNGLIFPFAWAEDDGLCVGGRPYFLKGCRWEITAEEFSDDLRKLEIKHPIPLPYVASPDLSSFRV